MQADAWELWLSERLQRVVRVRYGRARRQLLRARWLRSANSGAPAELELLLHRRFEIADESLREDLVAWIQQGKRARAACLRIEAWLDAELARAPLEQLPRSLPGGAERGAVHNLAALAHELEHGALANATYGPKGRPQLCWGRRGPSRAQRSLRLGSYDPHLRLVRLHPVLDQEAVPTFFARYILYHELLHVLEPARRDAAGRLLHHHADFRQRERAYPDFQAAQLWQQRNIAALIRSSRSGKPLVSASKPASASRLHQRRQQPMPSTQPVQALLFEL